MQKLVRLSTSLLFVIALGAYVMPNASAQEKSAGSKTTVTGCLQKGDEAGEYSITGEDGKAYELRSKTVKLSQHLGHKVTITGTRGYCSAGDIRWPTIDIWARKAFSCDSSGKKCSCQNCIRSGSGSKAMF